jgi:hypothetical protein
MKLQINGQSLRLRIEEDELQRLRDGAILTSTTLLPDGGRFLCSLELHPQAAVAFVVDAGAWRIALPRAAVEDYVGRLPCREGLAFQIAIGDADGIRLGFEVDVRDSTRRRVPRPRR